MHYSCLILTDDHKTDIEIIVGEVLAPYSEHIKVAPYDRDCICITNKRFKKLIANSDSPCPSCNGKGSYRSTYNPVAKWDYYSIIKKWESVPDSIIIALKKLLDAKDAFQPSDIFASVEPDGTWHESQPLFGICQKQAAQWPEKLMGLLSKHKNCRAVLCDLHI